jgi:16S rRNA (cytosine967-C5)-methyltransferase
VGAYTAQSRGAQVEHALAGLRIDRAPGGKTTHLAALMGDSGEIVAVERHAGRARALQRTCERMGATSVRVEHADAARFTTETAFDKALVDPPCSGLGTLQGHPDLRWRMDPESIERLARGQAKILEAARAAVRPGGTIVYATCTLSRAENKAVVAASGLSLDSERLVLPHRDRTDGFYIARLSCP